MNDWQNFATEPKRQELLTKLQAIADTPLAPTDQATGSNSCASPGTSSGAYAATNKVYKDTLTIWQNKHSPPAHTFRISGTAHSQPATAPATVRNWVSSWPKPTGSKLSENLKAFSQLALSGATILRSSKTEACRKTVRSLARATHDHIRQSKNQNFGTQATTGYPSPSTAELESDNEATDRQNLQQRWQQIGPAPRKKINALGRHLAPATGS